LIYNSIEILPMRIFLKVTQTGDLNLLGEGDEKQLNDCWGKIIEEFKEIDPDDIFKKQFSKIRHIEHLVCKYNAIKLGLWCLKIRKEESIIKMLSSYGYVIRRDDNYLDDITRAERFSIAIKDRIKQLTDELESEKSDEKLNFDKVIVRFNIIMGFKIANANKVTVSEYYAIKEEVEEKQKQIKKMSNKSK